MSATLVAKGLEAAHGDRLLFSGLDLVVGPGDVVGLVGVNGAGKSTLLRMLAGLRAADAGTVTVSPPDATIGYLPQEPDRLSEESVRQFLVSAHWCWRGARCDASRSGCAGGRDARRG